LFWEEKIREGGKTKENNFTSCTYAHTPSFKTPLRISFKRPDNLFANIMSLVILIENKCRSIAYNKL